MEINHCIKLAKLDCRLLLNMGAMALKTAGVLYSFPLLLTMILFMIIAVISNASRLFIDRDHNSNLQPWMVKYQFIFAYRQNKWKKGVDTTF
jgi:hypothetical protein